MNATHALDLGTSTGRALRNAAIADLTRMNPSPAAGAGQAAGLPSSPAERSPMNITEARALVATTNAKMLGSGIARAFGAQPGSISPAALIALGESQMRRLKAAAALFDKPPRARKKQLLARLDRATKGVLK